MWHILEQLGGAILSGVVILLAFALIFLPGLILTRGRSRSSDDEALWSTKQVRTGHRKGEEVPRYSEPLPVGKAYGDNERDRAPSKALMLGLIGVVAAALLAVLYIMPEVPADASALNTKITRQPQPVDKAGGTAAICIAAVAAVVYVTRQGGSKVGKRKTGQRGHENQPEPVQVNMVEAKRRSHRSRSRRKERL